MASALFVAGDYEVDVRVIQSVEQRQNYTAEIAEHRIDTLLDERINDNLCAGF